MSEKRFTVYVTEEDIAAANFEGGLDGASTSDPIAIALRRSFGASYAETGGRGLSDFPTRPYAVVDGYGFLFEDPDEASFYFEAFDEEYEVEPFSIVLIPARETPYARREVFPGIPDNYVWD